MRALFLVLMVAGCSFIGARVPANPEPEHHCPSGVVVADGIGTAFFLFPPTACAFDGAIGGFEGDNDGIACIMMGVPMAIIGTVYMASTIFGARANRRCERRKDAYVAPPKKPEEPVEEHVRAPVVGDEAMMCAITAFDVGLCFADETACKSEVERGGGACEARAVAWCFDVTTIVGGPIEATCVASRVDCDRRRTVKTHDASLVVSTCGTYQQRVPPPATEPALPAAP